jgi:hypothetical protein
MILNENNSRFFWICAAITSINALVSAGFSLAALRSGDVYAMYGASRSVALLLIAIALVWLRSRTGIAVMAALMSLVQAGDAIVGVLAHDLVKTLGPVVLCAATFVSLFAMLRAGGSIAHELRQ